MKRLPGTTTPQTRRASLWRNLKKLLPNHTPSLASSHVIETFVVKFYPINIDIIMQHA